MAEMNLYPSRSGDGDLILLPREREKEKRKKRRKRRKVEMISISDKYLNKIIILEISRSSQRPSIAILRSQQASYLRSVLTT